MKYIVLPNGLSIQKIEPKKKKYSGVVTDKNDCEVYIKEVIYRNPATIVLWSDRTKTVAKCSESDNYSEDAGLAICVLKKMIGGASLKNLYDDWLPENYSMTPTTKITLRDVIQKGK